MDTEENLRLMKVLDDAWNGQDWELFSKHHVENVIGFSTWNRNVQDLSRR